MNQWDEQIYSVIYLPCMIYFLLSFTQESIQDSYRASSQESVFRAWIIL